MCGYSYVCYRSFILLYIHCQGFLQNSVNHIYSYWRKNYNQDNTKQKMLSMLWVKNNCLLSWALAIIKFFPIILYVIFLALYYLFLIIEPSVAAYGVLIMNASSWSDLVFHNFSKCSVRFTSQNWRKIHNFHQNKCLLLLIKSFLW